MQDKVFHFHFYNLGYFLRLSKSKVWHILLKTIEVIKFPDKKLAIGWCKQKKSVKNSSGKKLFKAGMAVRLVVLFFESTFVKLFQAKRAHKMFGVKFARHSSNTSPTNRLMASSTKGTSFGMVMELTIRLTIMIKETSTIKWLAAILKEINITLM